MKRREENGRKRKMNEILRGLVKENKKGWKAMGILVFLYIKFENGNI
jgi:hypothetical protein